MNIEEIKKEKDILKQRIQILITDFQEQTGTLVDEIEVMNEIYTVAETGKETKPLNTYIKMDITI